MDNTEETTTVEDVTLARTMDTMDDVEKFLVDCEGFFGGGFHLDNPGSDYIESVTKAPTFTDRQAAAFDALVTRAFHVADVAGADLYQVEYDLYMASSQS